MILEIYLDFLDPPGALACKFQSKPEGEAEPEPHDKCLSIFFGAALNLTLFNLGTQILAAGKMRHGEKPPEYYTGQWQKTARPIATVRFGDGRYLLAYQPAAAGRHPLAAQAWKYLKVALNLVSDDAQHGLIFADPRSYETTLPLRLLAEHQKLPKLAFGISP